MFSNNYLSLDSGRNGPLFVPFESKLLPVNIKALGQIYFLLNLILFVEKSEQNSLVFYAPKIYEFFLLRKRYDLFLLLEESQTIHSFFVFFKNLKNLRNLKIINNNISFVIRQAEKLLIIAKISVSELLENYL